MNIEKFENFGLFGRKEEPKKRSDFFGKVKYIRTKEDTIIVFSENHQHKEFLSFDPISAGFIIFSVGKEIKKLIVNVMVEVFL